MSSSLPSFSLCGRRMGREKREGGEGREKGKEEKGGKEGREKGGRGGEERKQGDECYFQLIRPW